MEEEGGKMRKMEKKRGAVKGEGKIEGAQEVGEKMLMNAEKGRARRNG